MTSGLEMGEFFRKSGLPLESDEAGRLQRFVLLIEKWNSHVNLTASSQWSSIEPLLFEGIWASRKYPDKARRHLDIGSGAGFPAIPIKIMVPRIQLDMVESRIKKVSFLETVASELKLAETRVFHSRIAAHLEQHQAAWDCISWKAVKISTRDLLAMKRHAHDATEFWIFHGKELAVENPAILDHHFGLLRREQFPNKKDWMLSIYLPR